MSTAGSGTHTRTAPTSRTTVLTGPAAMTPTSCRPRSPGWPTRRPDCPPASAGFAGRTYGATLGETLGDATGAGITSFWPGTMRFGLVMPFAASIAWSVTPNEFAIRVS